MKLFEPYKLKNYSLPHRIVMAPMTRSRTSQPGNIPNKMMAEYYGQRAKQEGLIITEATQISEQGQGYSFTPGIHSEEQIEGWKLVTKAVHDAGGKIFLQLWHVGRLSHEMFHNGEKPVAPSAIAPDARIWAVNEENPEGAMLECPEPRALTIEEIKDIVDGFKQGAANAIEAGFDGVEIHGANGYLLDQFMRRTSNHRDDEYGGNMEGRARFILEVADAVIDEVGAERTGIRLAPFIKQRGMDDDEAIDAVLYIADKLNERGLAYIHLAEADWDDAPQIPEDFRRNLRDVYKGTVIVAGNYSKESGNEIMEKGLADLVAFGRPFIANPDLPYRYKNNLPLADFDPNSLFGGTKKGYTDYSKYEAD